jgi:hypothetical protein
MNHKQRRIAAYLKRGMTSKVEIARLAPNNRSKRARGKLRARYWSWRGPGKKPYAEAIKFGRVGW